MKGIVVSARWIFRAYLAASLLGVAILIAGCGQKGPLFLPDHQDTEVPASAPQPTTEPASEDTTKKKEEPR
jgi:predicted small lipoprotein YifL